MNIQEAFGISSTSTESQRIVNHALPLEHQDQHQSVSYHNVPASDLVNQNCSDISIPLVSESEVQTVYTDKPEPDSHSHDNPEVCSASLMQVSEIQRDQSGIPFVIAYHSWFVETKRDKLTEYFEFHPHQPKTTKFNATNVILPIWWLWKLLAAIMALVLWRKRSSILQSLHCIWYHY